MHVVDSILDLVGQTPLLRLKSLPIPDNVEVLVKMENLNPGGSVKDRIGLALIEDAEKRGTLKPESIVVEATSGNTGIALAMVATRKGYPAVFVVPDKMSSEKIRYMEGLGAKVILTSSKVDASHPDYYTNLAQRIVDETPGAILMNQFYNQANPHAHYLTTGPEVWQQTEGKVTHFVSGMGTGGTISGTGRYLKEQNPNVRIIGADPVGSVLKRFKETGELGSRDPYLVEGIGQEKIPDTLHLDLVDEIQSGADEDSFKMVRHLAKHEALFVGGSTGLNVKVAVDIAQTAPPGSVIVTIVCDTGERYLSKAHNPAWLLDNHLIPKDVGTASQLLRTTRDLSPRVTLVKPNTPCQELETIFADDLAFRVAIVEHDRLVGLVDAADVLGVGEVAESIMHKGVQTVEGSTTIDDILGLFRRGTQAIGVQAYGHLEGVLLPNHMRFFARHVEES